VGSTPKLGDAESFGVYHENLRVNPQILNVNFQLLWSIFKFGDQLLNLVVNPQIWGLTLKFWGLTLKFWEGFFRKSAGHNLTTNIKIHAYSEATHEWIRMSWFVITRTFLFCDKITSLANQREWWMTNVNFTNFLSTRFANYIQITNYASQIGNTHIVRGQHNTVIVTFLFDNGLITASLLSFSYL